MYRMTSKRLLTGLVSRKPKESSSQVSARSTTQKSFTIYIVEELDKDWCYFLGYRYRSLKEYPDLVKKYFGTIIPSADNQFAALNSAVWSEWKLRFMFRPGVKVEYPLQAYFRINSENMGQFERTLIIADEGSQVHYVEGCTAPTYSSESLTQCCRRDRLYERFSGPLYDYPELGE